MATATNYTDQQIAQYVIANYNNPALIRQGMLQTGITATDIKRALEPMREKAMAKGLDEANQWTGGDVGQGAGENPFNVLGTLEYSGITTDPKDPQQVGAWIKLRNSQSAAQTQQLLAELWGGADKVPQDAAYHKAVDAEWEAAGERDRAGNRSFNRNLKIATAIMVGGVAGGFNALGGALDASLGTVGLESTTAASLANGGPALADLAGETTLAKLGPELATGWESGVELSSLQNAALATGVYTAADLAGMTAAQLAALPEVAEMIAKGITPSGTSIFPGGPNNNVDSLRTTTGRITLPSNPNSNGNGPPSILNTGIDAATRLWMAENWKDFQDKLFSYMEKPPDRIPYQNLIPRYLEEMQNQYNTKVSPLFTDPLNAQGSWLNNLSQNIQSSVLGNEATHGRRLNAGLAANIANQTALGLTPAITGAQNAAVGLLNSGWQGLNSLSTLGGYNNNYNTGMGQAATNAQDKIMSNTASAIGDLNGGTNNLINTAWGALKDLFGNSGGSGGGNNTNWWDTDDSNSWVP